MLFSLVRFFFIYVSKKKSIQVQSRNSHETGFHLVFFLQNLENIFFNPFSAQNISQLLFIPKFLEMYGNVRKFFALRKLEKFNDQRIRFMNDLFDLMRV